MSEACRCPAGTLTHVKGMQVPCMYPDQCQGCAGILTGQVLAEIGLLSLWLSVSQGASLGDFPLAPRRPIEKVALWEGILCLTSGLTDWPSTIEYMLCRYFVLLGHPSRFCSCLTIWRHPIYRTSLVFVETVGAKSYVSSFSHWVFSRS